MTHKRIKNFRRSQGLIESIIAISILVTAIVALMAMSISAGNARLTNEYATVAADLAREGIEVVVAKRNDNWINDLAFDTGLYTGTDYTFALAFNPATSVWSFVNNPAGGAPNAIGDALAKVYKYTANGLMAQGTVAVPQPAGTVATPYSRLVTLDPICYDGATETTVTSGSSCTGSNIKIGVRITSTVQWLDKGISHNISAIETIYDWR